MRTPTKWLCTLEVILYMVIAFIHVQICPFSKVEESFNTQAIHDVINLFPSKLFGHDRQLEHDSFKRENYQWDHVNFPGVVPRTFLGSLTVGLMTKPFKYILESNDNPSQLYLQIISRMILASLMVVSLCFLARSIQRRYQLETRILFDLMMATQFHYMFYSSRLLPNTFAAILTNLVIAYWIDSGVDKSIFFVATSVLVFRFDSIIFFGWIILVGLILRKNISFKRLLTIGIPSGLLVLTATIAVDSYFWRRLVWPEGEGIYFNIWLNKSHEWGTQPHLWYFYSCLPRLILTGLFFLLLSNRFSMQNLLLPTMAFIATYSILPHKELRFIIYIVPVLNIVAADGMTNLDWLLTNFNHLGSKTIKIKENAKENPIFILYLFLRLFNKKDTTNLARATTNKITLRYLYLIMIALVLSINIAMTSVFLAASKNNYPGGQSSTWLHKNLEVLKSSRLEGKNSSIGVYVGNLAAQTGFTRFLQVDNIYYNKDAHMDPDEMLSNTFTTSFLILELDEVSKFESNFCGGTTLLHDSEAECRHNGGVGGRFPIRFCSFVNTNMIFDSILFDRSSLILVKTRPALKTIRCGKSSKFNPFI